ncbi:MAG: isocitrate lyase/phosphoenolpyruvate mutase family protein [Candidatus Eremiobacteraeota bacterium]|nr:isocitrate lyase/phosphoenolpyruvate mutase family protein [Candidatus Eremiobacteraeota bacterium]
MGAQRDLADRFRAMHVSGDPVLLPNAWDAASARVLESLAFGAVATTSAGVAFLEGFADGQDIGRNAMLAGVARIVRAVHVPVTADMEGGYGPTVADAVATALGVIASGAIGLNFEDATSVRGELMDADKQAERIAAIRRTGEEYGLPLVINARTDVYLAEIGDPKNRFVETVRRAKVYRAAGADCIFVPGVLDAETIGALVRAIDAPINILAAAATPPLVELRQLGVARVSLGSAPFRRALSAFRDLALEARDGGSFAGCGGILTHAEANALYGA